MNLHKLILTNNACYKAGRTIVPKELKQPKPLVKSDVLAALNYSDDWLTVIKNGGHS